LRLRNRTLTFFEDGGDLVDGLLEILIVVWSISIMLPLLIFGTVDIDIRVRDSGKLKQEGESE